MSIFKKCLSITIPFSFLKVTYVRSENFESKKNSRIVFLGTGSSTGLPHPYHLMNPDEYSPEEKYMCNVSIKAAVGNPIHNKNYRCNPSLLIQYRKSNQLESNIIIDCGKTFRESIIRWFPLYQVKSVEAILLTHGPYDILSKMLFFKCKIYT